MKPAIGIPLRSDADPDGRCYQYVFETPRRALQKAGALLLPLAPVQDIDYYATPGGAWPALTADELADMDVYLDMVDGLFIPGGFKFCQYDRELLAKAVSRDIPVLGVCLGLQMMSVYGENEVAFPKVADEARHCNREDRLAHDVIIEPDSLLYRLVGESRITVNSWHRRCVTANATYRTVAVSDDGVIEAMELPGARFHLGVQWHPEVLYGTDAYATALIDGFVAACAEYAEIKA